MMGNNSSIIEHKEGMYYTEFREDYILLCRQLQRPKTNERNHASPYCKACILSIMERWTNYKINRHEDPGIKMSLPQWELELYEFFARNVITDSLKELLDDTLLERQEIKNLHGGRPTYRYYLKTENVNRRLRELPNQSPFQTPPTVINQRSETPNNDKSPLNTRSNSDKSTFQQGLINVATVTNQRCSSSPTLINQPFINVIDSDIDSNINNNSNGNDSAASTTASAVRQDASSLSQKKEELPVDPPSTPSKKERTQRKRPPQESKLIALEDFDLDLPATIENIMALGDAWRGGPLPVSMRKESKYQRALVEGATPLSQRVRRGGKKGYSLREIDMAYRFFNQIPPQGKEWLIADEWWDGKPIDLWVIGSNIERALNDIAKLVKKHEKSSTSTSTSTSAQSDPNKQVLWTDHPEHPGDPLSHWYLYRWMPLSEAIKHDYLPIPGDYVNRIDIMLKKAERGEIKRPTEGVA